MRWIEWGHPPEPEDPQWWLMTTLRECGRDELPVTFVAHDESGEVVGAVGLDVYDLEERQEVTPWVTGMIVRRDCRGRGVGRRLLQHLEAWAAHQKTDVIWVATDLAAEFYRRCGYTGQEMFTRSDGQEFTVLSKQLQGENRSYAG